MELCDVDINNNLSNINKRLVLLMRANLYFQYDDGHVFAGIDVFQYLSDNSQFQRCSRVFNISFRSSELPSVSFDISFL